MASLARGAVLICIMLSLALCPLLDALHMSNTAITLGVPTSKRVVAHTCAQERLACPTSSDVPLYLETEEVRTRIQVRFLLALYVVETYSAVHTCVTEAVEYAPGQPIALEAICSRSSRGSADQLSRGQKAWIVTSITRTMSPRYESDSQALHGQFQDQKPDQSLNFAAVWRGADIRDSSPFSIILQSV